MERIITIKDRVGMFDIPTFYVSENEDLLIKVKREDKKPLKNYRMLVKHGKLTKAFTLFNEGAIELKADWICRNDEPIEFDLIRMDEAGIKLVSGEGIEIEPLLLKKLQGKFEYSSAVQKLIKWQDEHGKQLEVLEKRFASYECNGTILQTE